MNSEVWLRAQYQAVVKERDQLQEKVRLLERDNGELKRAVQDLSLLVTQRHPEYALHVGERRFKQVNDISDTNGADTAKKTSSPLKQRQLSADEAADSAGKLEVLLEGELKGHVGSVYCGQFSCDGRWIASGGLDQTVRVWDAKGMKQVCAISDHSQLVSDVLWTQAKPSLFSCSYDKSLRCYDVDRGVCVSSTRLKAFGTRLAHCAASGVLVALNSSREWFVVDPRNMSSGFGTGMDDACRGAATHTHSCLPTCAVCLEDGFGVVLGDAEGNVSLFDLRKSPRPVFSLGAGQSVKVLDLAACNDVTSSSILAAQCSDNAVRLFDVSRGGSPNAKPMNYIGSLRGHDTSHWPIRIAWHKGLHFSRRTSLNSEGIKKQQYLSPAHHRIVHETRFAARRSNSMNALLRPMHSSSPPLTTSPSSRADEDENCDDLFDNVDATSSKIEGDSSSDNEEDVLGTISQIAPALAPTASSSNRVIDGIEDYRSTIGIDWDHTLVLATGCSSGKVFLHNVTEVDSTATRHNCSTFDASSGGAHKINGVAFDSLNNSMISYCSEGLVKVWSLSTKTNVQS